MLNQLTKNQICRKCRNLQNCRKQQCKIAEEFDETIKTEYTINYVICSIQKSNIKYKLVDCTKHFQDFIEKYETDSVYLLNDSIFRKIFGLFPKFGKFEIEEVIYQNFIKALIEDKDLTDFFNTSYYYNDFPYNESFITKEVVLQEFIRFFEVEGIEENVNLCTMDFCKLLLNN
ncbi:MAG: hypothetical protein RSB67_02875 [Clostridia bacterium]